jgi:hypothetical protein
MAFGAIIAAKSVARSARFMSKGAMPPEEPEPEDEDPNAALHGMVAGVLFAVPVIYWLVALGTRP